MTLPNCATFADTVIEGMGWPGVFRECPLMRTTLELAVAIGFEKFQRGDYGPMPSPGTFASQVEGIADNELIGRIDLLPDDLWAGRRDFRRAFFAAVAAAFAVLTAPTEPVDGDAETPRRETTAARRKHQAKAKE